MVNKSRFKNYGLWVSVVALIPVLLKGIGIDILPDNYGTVTNSILGILVMLGILNDPTTECKWFSDDTKKTENNIKI